MAFSAVSDTWRTRGLTECTERKVTIKKPGGERRIS